MHALVIGGGIGGLSAAIALRCVGWQVSLFEQADSLREVGAGITIWSNAIKALRKMQAAEGVLAAGSVALRRGEVRRQDGKVLATLESQEIAKRTGAPTVVIHRGRLLESLQQAYSGEVHTAHRCLGFEIHSNGVTARFENGHEAHGDLLLGADGIHSMVREQLHGATSPRFAGHLAWRGVTEFSHPDHPEGSWSMSLGPGAHFGYLPLSGNQVYWFGTRLEPPGSQAPQSPRQEAAAQFRGWHAPIEDVIAATEESAVLRNDIIDRPPLRRWGDRNVTLLGDAAHATTPNMGQGACQAIEDAAVLASCLTRTRDVTEAIQAYEALRIPRTSSVIRDSKRIGDIVHWRNPIACKLRDGMFQLLQGTWLKRNLKYAGYEVPELESEKT